MASTRDHEPVFPLFVDDLLSGTSDLSLAEMGAYCRLLFASWSKRGLPDEPSRLARIANASTEEFDEIWDYIADKFSKNEAGLLINERAERTRSEQEEFRRKKQEAGRKGGRRKAKRKQNGSSATPCASGLPVAKSYPPTPTPSPVLDNIDLKEPSSSKEHETASATNKEILEIDFSEIFNAVSSIETKLGVKPLSVTCLKAIAASAAGLGITEADIHDSAEAARLKATTNPQGYFIESLKNRLANFDQDLVSITKKVRVSGIPCQE